MTMRGSAIPENNMPPASTSRALLRKFFLLPVLILGFFSVAPLANAATLTITAPAAGASWQAGTTHTITWTPSGGILLVLINLIKISTNTTVLTISSGASNTGSYSWTIPAALAPLTNDYKIYVQRSPSLAIDWGYSSPFSITAVLDTTPPVISLIVASSITSSGATISWTTNEASDSQIDYGLTASYGNTTALDASLVTSHSQSLSGLSVSTFYHYRVRSRDAAGNLALSADNTFTTIVAPDTTPPSVPTGFGATAVSQSQIDLSWTTSTDPVVSGQSTSGVAGYWIYRNGGATPLNASLITTTSYSDIGLSPSTSYSYTIEAQDNAGNKSAKSSPASATTQAPPPPPNVSGYAWADTGIGWIHLSGTATDGSPYGVLVSSASPGVLSGYAWANPNDGAQNNIGWIDFRPAGPYPASSFVPAQSARMNRTTGLVTGWARALAYTDAQAGGWDGWIGFGTGGNYTQPVTVSGCNWSGYAWGGGTTIGWIHFGGALYPTTGSGDGCAALPDLSAGAVSPTSATAGTATTFSATISNSTAPTGASFPYFFQVATAAGGGGTVTDLAYSTMPALAAGASAPATSPSYTFTTAGTYSVRACANKTDRSTFGSIVESSYSNNCTDPWTDVTVTAPTLTGTFSASSYTVDPGGFSMLTWTSNADSCKGSGFSTGSGDPANSTGSGISTGPLPSNPNPYNYILTCKKIGYEDAIRSVSVIVISVTASISAKPTCISGGGSAKLFWNVAPASQIASCSVSKVLPLPEVPLSTQLTSPVAGLSVTIPNTRSTYTISCTTTGGVPVTKSVIVDVRSCWTEF